MRKMDTQNAEDVNATATAELAGLYLLKLFLIHTSSIKDISVLRSNHFSVYVLENKLFVYSLKVK